VRHKRRSLTQGKWRFCETDLPIQQLVQETQAPKSVQKPALVAGFFCPKFSDVPDPPAPDSYAPIGTLMDFRAKGISGRDALT
jgi:hypothetical protein